MEFRADIDQSGFKRFAEQVFVQPGLRVSESHSAPGCSLRSFSSAMELAQYASDITADEKGLMDVALWLDGSGPAPVLTKTPLALAAGGEVRFRDQLMGWGLIQLQFSRKPAFRKLFGSCRLSVKSRQDAQNWHSTYPELGPPEAWNWTEVETLMSQLGRALKRLGPSKAADRS